VSSNLDKKDANGFIIGPDRGKYNNTNTDNVNRLNAWYRHIYNLSFTYDGTDETLRTPKACEQHVQADPGKAWRKGYINIGRHGDPYNVSDLHPNQGQIGTFEDSGNRMVSSKSISFDANNGYSGVTYVTTNPGWWWNETSSYSIGRGCAVQTWCKPLAPGQSTSHDIYGNGGYSLSPWLRNYGNWMFVVGSKHYVGWGEPVSEGSYSSEAKTKLVNELKGSQWWSGYFSNDKQLWVRMRSLPRWKVTWSYCLYVLSIYMKNSIVPLSSANDKNSAYVKNIVAMYNKSGSGRTSMFSDFEPLSIYTDFKSNYKSSYHWDVEGFSNYDNAHRLNLYVSSSSNPINRVT
tara:strand:- start:313 stop:1353 length:1041 start_codon:yes stop_codon:yes gene_type:complete